jgi:hypothetical protein
MMDTSGTSPVRRLVTGLLLIATLLVGANDGVRAALVVREIPLELATSKVPLWQLNIGRLGVRRCDDCSVTWLRIDDATRFEVAYTGSVERGQFVDRASEAAGRNGTITLFLEPDTNYVRRLHLAPLRTP